MSGRPSSPESAEKRLEFPDSSLHTRHNIVSLCPYLLQTVAEQTVAPSLCFYHLAQSTFIP